MSKSLAFSEPFFLTLIEPGESVTLSNSSDESIAIYGAHPESDSDTDSKPELLSAPDAGTES